MFPCSFDIDKSLILLRQPGSKLYRQHVCTTYLRTVVLILCRSLFYCTFCASVSIGPPKYPQASVTVHLIRDYNSKSLFEKGPTCGGGGASVWSITRKSWTISAAAIPVISAGGKKRRHQRLHFEQEIYVQTVIISRCDFHNISTAEDTKMMLGTSWVTEINGNVHEVQSGESSNDTLHFTCGPSSGSAGVSKLNTTMNTEVWDVLAHSGVPAVRVEDVWGLRPRISNRSNTYWQGQDQDLNTNEKE